MALRTTMDAIEAMPLFAAAKPRDAGQAAAEACTAKAERSGFDTASAKAAVLKLLADGRARSGEELVDHCLRLGLVPHDSRAFGSVFGALSRAGAIEAVGHAPRRKGHGTSGGIMWKAAAGRNGKEA
jgi:hypothetical protein